MPGFLADAHPSTSVLLGYLLAVGLVTSSLAFVAGMVRRRFAERLSVTEEVPLDEALPGSLGSGSYATIRERVEDA